MKQAEQQSGTLEEISTKGTVTIQTLQRENREAQERVIDLESRLRYLNCNIVSKDAVKYTKRQICVVAISKEKK